jgi:hypothetical protein
MMMIVKMIIEKDDENDNDAAAASDDNQKVTRENCREVNDFTLHQIRTTRMIKQRKNM